MTRQCGLYEPCCTVIASAGRAQTAQCKPTRGFMDLRLNDEQKMIAESASIFLQEKSTSAQVRHVSENGDGMDRALWQEAVEMGWMGVALPESAGGMGLGWMELVLLQEKMGYHLACIPFFDAVVALNPLWQHLAQSEEGGAVVERLAQSGQVCVLGLSVHGDLLTQATVQQKGDQLFLSGLWPQVGSGPHADVLILPATLPCGNLALVEVAAKATGMQVAALKTMDGTRSSAQVSAHQVCIEAAQILVQGPALQALWPRLRCLAAIGLAAEQVGVAERALDLTVNYTKERQQFGKAVAVFQGVKHRAAQMLIKIETARSAVYGAAFMADAKASEEELLMFAAQARTEATEAALFATRESIQLHGGVGFTWEFDPHLYFRRAQSASQRLGSVAQWREAVAQQILGGAVKEIV